MKNERKLAAHTIKPRSSALRFLYVHTLWRLAAIEMIPASVISLGRIVGMCEKSHQKCSLQNASRGFGL